MNEHGLSRRDFLHLSAAVGASSFPVSEQTICIVQSSEQAELEPLPTDEVFDRLLTLERFPFEYLSPADTMRSIYHAMNEKVKGPNTQPTQDIVMHRSTTEFNTAAQQAHRQEARTWSYDRDFSNTPLYISYDGSIHGNPTSKLPWLLQNELDARIDLAVSSGMVALQSTSPYIGLTHSVHGLDEGTSVALTNAWGARAVGRSQFTQKYYEGFSRGLNTETSLGLLLEEFIKRYPDNSTDSAQGIKESLSAVLDQKNQSCRFLFNEISERLTLDKKKLLSLSQESDIVGILQEISNGVDRIYGSEHGEPDHVAFKLFTIPDIVITGTSGIFSSYMEALFELEKYIPKPEPTKPQPDIFPKTTFSALLNTTRSEV